MKFGKRLRQLVQESDEEWRPNFMDYKVLKKSIISRDINPNDLSATNSNSDESYSENNDNFNLVNFQQQQLQQLQQQQLQQQQQQQHHMDTTVHEQSLPPTESSPVADTSLTKGKINDVRNPTYHDTMLYQCQHHRNRPHRRRKQQDSTAMQDSDDDEDEDLAIVVDRIDDMPAHKRAVLEAERLHTEFFRLLRREVDKVNEFFLEKQEDFIIEHRRLAMRVAQLDEIPLVSRRDINVLRSRLTNFHGDLVVLEKFSTVNYTGFRKILKKHDKKAGLNIQYTYLNTVLLTPFFLSDTVRRLILSTEALLSRLDEFVK